MSKWVILIDTVFSSSVVLMFAMYSISTQLPFSCDKTRKLLPIATSEKDNDESRKRLQALLLLKRLA